VPRHDYKPAVIPDLVNVGAFVDLLPVQAAISREKGRHSICKLAVQPFSDVAHRKNEADSTILRVGWREKAVM
jgi:hypothetical protein